MWLQWWAGGYGDKTGIKWCKPALHLLRKPSLKRFKLCAALWCFLRQKCIVPLRTCCANAVTPEYILCVWMRLPVMCVLRLHLVCHSLGAIVNATLSTALCFSAFWVSMCAEIVPFSQCLCVHAWPYPTERRVRPARLETLSDARGGFLPLCWLTSSVGWLTDLQARSNNLQARSNSFFHIW